MLVSFAALAIRCLVYYFVEVPVFTDAQDYLIAGKTLWQDGVIHNHKLMPLYPLWAYASECLAGMPILDMMADALTCYMLGLLASSIFSHPVGLASAIIWAIYPFSIFYSFVGLSESLFVLLTVTAFYLLYRNKLWLASMVLVIGIMTRPVFDFLNPLLIVVFGLIIHKKSWTYIVKNLGKYFVMYVLLLSPWWLHNMKQYGQFVRTNLGSGQIWMEGSHPRNMDGGTIPMEVYMADYEGIKDPMVLNNKMTSDAWTYISTDVSRYVVLSFKKLLRLWNIVPNSKDFQSRKYKFIAAISFGPIFILFFAYLFSINSKDLMKILPIVLTMIYVTAIHVVTVASIRYRFPLEAFMIMIAAAFLINNINKFLEKKRGNYRPKT